MPVAVEGLTLAVSVTLAPLFEGFGEDPTVVVVVALRIYR